MVAHEHDVMIRGLDLDGRGSEPTILRRIDQTFIPAILQELERENGLRQIAESQVQRPAATVPMTLFQPVHRVFHVALCEVACDIFGEPRFDPQQIDSTGLVVRRVVATNTAGQASAVQGWIESGGSLRGWMPLSDEMADPDPAFRRPEVAAGHAEITRRIALYRNGAQTQPLAESVAPLFVAPPAVCAATKKTLVYGLVSVASGEYSESPDELTSFADDDLAGHIHKYLRPNALRSFASAGRVLNASHADGTGLTSSQREEMDTLLLLIQQVAVEFGAFGDTAAAKQLYSALNDIALPMHDDSQLRAGDFLAQAARVLVEQIKGEQITMPQSWPKIDEARANQLLAAIKQGMLIQFAGLSAGRRRFDEPNQLYQLRAFVRVNRHPECPPEIIWSAPSHLFTIAPWYESVPDPAPPPVQVALPNPFDRDALKKLKPNVAFQVPKQLADFIEGNSTDAFLDGDASEKSTPFALDWICGFNIPIITLCAFIVLNIFLSLFNLAFRWLMFIKICIPIPR